MSSKQGRFSCACRGCNSRSRDCALFQFPQDAERAKLWMKNCNREDLMAKLSSENWYKNHKVCERHIESKFISTNSDVRMRLMPDAYPTLFLPLPGETTEPPRKVVILSDPTFLEDITNKYYSLHRRGLLMAHNDDSSDEDNCTGVNVVDGSVEQEEEPCSNDGNSNNRFIWPRNGVLSLLEELLKRKQQLLQPHKRRILFSQVAGVLVAQGYKVNWEICDRKWRGLQTMYKKILNKENASGSGAINWEYYNQVQEIVATDPSYNPVTTISAGVEAIKYVNKDAQKRKSNDEPHTKKTKLSKDYIETQFSIVNENLRSLDSTINKLVDVQERRNDILDRLVSSLETGHYTK